MTPLNQFTGIPFVAGSIFGERCWKVSTKGVLVSPTYPYGWKPDNKSECRKVNALPPVSYDEVLEFLENKVLHGKRVISIERELPFGGGTTPKALYVHWKEIMPKKVAVGPDPISLRTESVMAEVVLETVKFHEAGAISLDWLDLYRVLRPSNHPDWKISHHFPDCSCGFYAYTNGTNVYIQKNRAMGVVEGYGETLIGTRGFRSSKARVIALTDSPPAPEPVIGVGGMGGAGRAIVTVTASASAATASFGNLVSSSGAGGGGGASSGSAGRATMSIHRTIESGTQPFASPGISTAWTPEVHPVIDEPIDWDKVLANYPGAVYFDSVEKMRAEFPSTDVSDWLN